MGRIPNRSAGGNTLRADNEPAAGSIVVTQLDYLPAEADSPADSPAAGKGKRARKRATAAAPEPAQPVGELEAVAPADSPADGGEHQQPVAPVDSAPDAPADSERVFTDAELAEFHRHAQARAYADSEAELARIRAGLPKPASAAGGRTPTGRSWAETVRRPPAGEWAMPTRPVSLPRATLLRGLAEDERGDAVAFAELNAGRLMFDLAERRWYRFTGHIWQRMLSEPIDGLSAGLAAEYLGLAAALTAQAEGAVEDDARKLHAQADAAAERARKLRSTRRCKAVLEQVRGTDLLGRESVPWDADPYALAVANGVIDLRTGQMRGGVPDDFLRTAAPTDWAGLDAPAPRWQQFILEVMSGEADRAEFLYRLLGYAVNGTTDAHLLVLLIGERGRNGKTLLFSTLSHVLGPHAAAVSTDVIVGQDAQRAAGSAQPHIVALRGKRIAYASETLEGARMSAAMVKMLTGGDRIVARQLYSEPVDFAPSHTLFLATNRRPQATADDDALWARIRVLEFRTRFVDSPTAPDEQPADPTLESTLRSEASGVLAWLVRGHLAYLADGLRAPDSVRLARDSYRRSESIDPFLADCCLEWDGGQAEAGALWDAYGRWCDADGLRRQSQTWLGRQLAARFEKGRNSVGRAVYYGVALRD